VICQGTVELIVDKNDICNRENSSTYITTQPQSTSSHLFIEAEIRISGDVIGNEEFKISGSTVTKRKFSAIAVSQVKVLTLKYSDFRHISRMSWNEDQRLKIHFLRTCHNVTLLGKIAETQGFTNILPLLKPQRYENGSIISKQGDCASNFYILKSGTV